MNQFWNICSQIGTQNWDLRLKVFPHYNLHASPFAIMDTWPTSHNLLYADVSRWFYSQILVYAYKATTKNYLSFKKDYNFYSDRNGRPLQFTAIQIQTILHGIDCTSHVWETLKVLTLLWVSGEFHHDYFSHNAS